MPGQDPLAMGSGDPFAGALKQAGPVVPAGGTDPFAAALKTSVAAPAPKPSVPQTPADPFSGALKASVAPVAGYGHNGQAYVDKLHQVAANLGVHADDLARVIHFESGHDAANVNGQSGATGLIQFMPSTARDLGTTTEALRGMSAVQQLDYVQKYLANQHTAGKSFSDLYAAVLAPAFVGKPDSTPMYVQGRDGKKYAQNAGLDTNHDGKITKGEAAAHAFGKGYVSPDNHSILINPSGIHTAPVANAKVRDVNDPLGDPTHGVADGPFSGDATVPPSQIGTLQSRLAHSLLPVNSGLDSPDPSEYQAQLEQGGGHVQKETAKGAARADARAAAERADPFLALNLPFTAHDFNVANDQGLSAVLGRNGKQIPLDTAIRMVQAKKGTTGTAFTKNQSQVEQDQANALSPIVDVGTSSGFQRGVTSAHTPRGGAQFNQALDPLTGEIRTPSQASRRLANDTTQSVSHGIQSMGVHPLIADLLAGLPTAPLHVAAEMGTASDPEESAVNRQGALTNLAAFAATDSAGRVAHEALTPVVKGAIAALKDSPLWERIAGAKTPLEATQAVIDHGGVSPEQAAHVVQAIDASGEPVDWKAEQEAVAGSPRNSKPAPAARATSDPLEPTPTKPVIEGVGEPSASAASREAPAPAHPDPAEAVRQDRVSKAVADVTGTEPTPRPRPEPVTNGANAETTRPAPAPEVAAGATEPTPEGAPAIADTTSGRNATVEAERTARGESPVEMQAYTTPEEAHAAGKAAVESGDIRHEDLATEVANNPRPVSTTEHGALLEGRRRLINEFNQKGAVLDAAIDAKSPDLAARQAEFDDVKNRLNLNDQALKKSGRQTSASLNARKMGTQLDTGDYAQMYQEARRTKGADLNPAESEKLKKVVADAKAAHEKLSARVTELEAENGSLKKAREDAQAGIDRASNRRGARRTRDAIRADRVKAQTDLYKSLSGTANFAGTFNRDAAQAIKRIAQTYIEEGVTTLADLIDRMRAHLDDEGITLLGDGQKDVPEGNVALRERDVYDALAGKHDEPVDPKQSRTDYARLKQMAGIASKMHDVLDGTYPDRAPEKVADAQVAAMRQALAKLKRTTGYDAVPATDPAKQLAQRIQAALHELAHGPEEKAASVQAPDTSEVAAMKARLSALKDRIEAKYGDSPDAKAAKQVAALESKIAETQAKVQGHYRTAADKPQPKKLLPDDVKAATAKLRDVQQQMKVQDKIDDLETQLKANDVGKYQGEQAERKAKRDAAEAAQSKELKDLRMRAEIAETRVQNHIAAMTKTTSAEAAKQTYRAMLVSSAGIPVKVAKGFALGRVADSLGAIPAVTWDALLSKVTGQRASGLDVDAVARGLRGAKEKASFARLLAILKGHIVEDSSGATNNLHGIHTRLPALDAVVNTIFNSHSAMYSPLKGYGYDKSIAEQATLAAMNAKNPALRQQLIDEPTKAMIDRANAEGNEAILMNRNRLAEMGTNRRGIKETAAGTAADLAMTLVSPVPSVASNAAGRVLEHSPAGFVKAGLEGASAIKKARAGDLEGAFANQRESSKAFGRASAGLAGLYAGYLLFKNNAMSGEYSQKVNGSRTAAEGGHGNILIPGLPARYQNLDVDESPFGKAMAIGALWAEQEDQPGAEASFWYHLTDPKGLAPFITGPVPDAAKTVGKIVNDPEKEGGAFAQNAALGFLTPLGTIAKLTDYGHDRKAEDFGDKAKLKVPGLRQTVPER